VGAGYVLDVARNSNQHAVGSSELGSAFRRQPNTPLINASCVAMYPEFETCTP
jgi:hypothetical protein